MKKIFIALSVLAALTMGVGSALAVPGVPDLAPGTNFVGMFLVSKTAVDTGSGGTTEYLISEVKGITTSIHMDFYDENSNWVHNTTVDLTAWGTKLINVATLIEQMNDTEREALLVTFQGEDYYMGYFYADNDNAAGDNLLVDWYILDLAKGLASASGVPVKEFYNNTTYTARICGDVDWTYEKWSASALSAAQDLVWGNTPVDPVWFAFYGRYLINDLTSGKTIFALWSSQKGTSAGGTTSFHIYVINKEEKFRSTTIETKEVTFIDAIDYIAQYLIDTDEAPYAGIFNFTYPGATRGGGLLPSPSVVAPNVEWLGYNWQYDKDTSAALNWDVLTQMARDVGTIGIDPATGKYDPTSAGTSAPQPQYIQ